LEEAVTPTTTILRLRTSWSQHIHCCSNNVTANKLPVLSDPNPFILRTWLAPPFAPRTNSHTSTLISFTRSLLFSFFYEAAIFLPTRTLPHCRCSVCCSDRNPFVLRTWLAPRIYPTPCNTWTAISQARSLVVVLFWYCASTSFYVLFDWCSSWSTFQRRQIHTSIAVNQGHFRYTRVWIFSDLLFGRRFYCLSCRKVLPPFTSIKRACSLFQRYLRCLRHLWERIKSFVHRQSNIPLSCIGKANRSECSLYWSRTFCSRAVWRPCLVICLS
jgi:hypothetical protein